MKYPTYEWKDDLRRKTTKEDVANIQVLQRQGLRPRAIQNLLGLTFSIVRYWMDVERHREKWRENYRKKTKKRKADRSTFNKCLNRKKKLCANFKSWRLEYDVQYRKEHPVLDREKRAAYHREWRKLHPHYQRDYYRRKQECHVNQVAEQNQK